MGVSAGGEAEVGVSAGGVRLRWVCPLGLRLRSIHGGVEVEGPLYPL